ncbi:uncharacterized protein LOC21398362 [Morus notabilis]|nr:uncharacterized protein LOC21398362 [Morus notabilis]
MVQKRPYDEEEILKISFKHPRQVEVEHNKQLISFSDSVFPEDAFEKPKTLEKGLTNAGTEVDKKLSGDNLTDPPKGGEDIDSSAPGSFSFSSWPTSSTGEEDSLSEPPFLMSVFPEYYSLEHPVRTLAHCEDIYSLLLNHPPHKTIPIGPNHQADVPSWDQQCARNISSLSCPSEEVSKSEVEEEKRLMGTCILPLPDLDSPAYPDLKVGKGRTDCDCEEKGSFGCVGKHIVKAREELLKTFGAEKFMELGFGDMGEQVAQSWSVEEEQTFHQIVFCHPASLGWNFWDKLSAAFLSRTKKEIVSYYFNVFMLRKRAEQNRHNPTNIDSDNDEWEGGDDDSVIDSPVSEDDTGNMQSRGANLLECNEDVAVTDDICDDNVNLDLNAPKSPEISEMRPENLSNYGSSPKFLPQDTTADDEKGDQEVQDDSCTSSETGIAALRNQMESENGIYCPSSFIGLSNHVKSENGNHCLCRLSSSLSGGGDIGYVLEHCEAKDCDVGYMTCSKDKVDFLPTCNMIEEVFGQEIRNHWV